MRALAAVLAASLAVPAEARAAAPAEMPFSAEEDADGARFVWFVHQTAGFPYEYVPAKALRDSPHFRAVPAKDGAAGDVAWWPSRAAIVGLSGTLRGLGRTPERIADVEARLGPVTILQYVPDPPPQARRIDFRRFGVRALATSPDAYVWPEARQVEQPRLAFLQIYRRDLRLPDGADADASFGLLLEKLDAPMKPRNYAELLRGREITRGAKLSDEGGTPVLRKDCDGRPCRLVVSVRVEGDVGAQAMCIYGRAIEPQVRADCAAWLASIAVAKAPVRPADPADPLVERGGKRLDDGDPAAALDDFRAARRRDPANTFAWSEEAAALAAMHEWPACVTAATSALERQPDRFEALATRAACLAQQSKPGAALSDLDAALALSPLPAAYVSRALLRAELGNAEGARSDAQQVARLEPGLVPRVERLLKE